jgi:hypothetical protein
MAITVTNKSADDIQVSISTWGNYGDPNPYPVGTGITESWDRKDPRGFVLYLQKGATAQPYYVQAGAAIVFFSFQEVTDNGEPIHPVSAP